MTNPNFKKQLTQRGRTTSENIWIRRETEVKKKKPEQRKRLTPKIQRLLFPLYAAVTVWKTLHDVQVLKVVKAVVFLTSQTVAALFCSVQCKETSVLSVT